MKLNSAGVELSFPRGKESCPLPLLKVDPGVWSQLHVRKLSRLQAARESSPVQKPPVLGAGCWVLRAGVMRADSRGAGL